MPLRSWRPLRDRHTPRGRICPDRTAISPARSSSRRTLCRSKAPCADPAEESKEAAEQAGNVAARTITYHIKLIPGPIDFISPVSEFRASEGGPDVGGHCSRYLAGFGGSHSARARGVRDLHSRVTACGRA